MRFKRGPMESVSGPIFTDPLICRNLAQCWARRAAALKAVENIMKFAVCMLVMLTDGEKIKVDEIQQFCAMGWSVGVARGVGILDCNEVPNSYRGLWGRKDRPSTLLGEIWQMLLSLKPSASYSQQHLTTVFCV